MGSWLGQGQLAGPDGQLAGPGPAGCKALIGVTTSWTVVANMDPNSRIIKKNTSFGDEELPKHLAHLVHRPWHQLRSQKDNQSIHRTTQRHPDYSQKTQTKMVWTCHKIYWSGKNHPVRHIEREKKERQAEKELE